jgi:hypothetical protein
MVSNPRLVHRASGTLGAKSVRTKPSNKERPDQPDKTSGKWRQYRLQKLLLALAAPVILLGVLELGLVLGGYGYNPSFIVRGPRTGSVVSNPR